MEVRALMEVELREVWGLSGMALNPRGMAKSSGWGSPEAELSEMGLAMSDLAELPQVWVQ